MKKFIENTRYSDIQRKLCRGIILKNKKTGDKTIKEWFELEDGYKLTYTKIIEKNGNREYFLKKYIVFTTKKEKCKLFNYCLENRSRWIAKCGDDTYYHKKYVSKENNRRG